MRLSDYPLDELHQLVCAANGDTGVVCAFANLLYRGHVRLIVALLRVRRRRWRRS